MYSFTGNKINTIKENGSFGILIEVGAGMPVYNELCKHPNTASKIVYYAQSPNNWDYNIKLYNHNVVRAVSPEVCQNFIIHHYDATNTNFILTNTIQIANDKNVVSHGWFGYKNKDVTCYYHYTINHHQSRKTQLDVIAKIGLDIIAANGDLSKLTNGYIDIILDVYKDPITAKGSKKSKRGILRTIYNPEFGYKTINQYDTVEGEDMLQLVFLNGDLFNIQTYEDILHTMNIEEQKLDNLVTHDDE